ESSLSAILLPPCVLAWRLLLRQALDIRCIVRPPLSCALGDLAAGFRCEHPPLLCFRPERHRLLLVVLAAARMRRVVARLPRQQALACLRGFLDVGVVALDWVGRLRF